MHLCIYLCMYVSVYQSMYVCMYLCMYVSMYVSIYICIYACMYPFMYVCMYVCMSACVGIYLCMYVCIYLLLHPPPFFLPFSVCASHYYCYKHSKTDQTVTNLGIISLLVSAHRIINLVLGTHTREISPRLKVDPVLVEAVNLMLKKERIT